jgi:hypothetical protein
MNKQQIAQRIVEIADKKQGLFHAGELPQSDVEYGQEHGWILVVGIGTFEVTELCRAVASFT